MKRTRIYKSINPPIDTLDQEIETEFFLADETIEDDNGNPVKHNAFDANGELVSSLHSFYDGKGNLIRVEEFSSFETDSPDTKTIRNFDEENRLVSESVYFFDDLIKETTFRYNSYGNISEQVYRSLDEGGQEEINRSVFHYHIAAPSCCIREAYFHVVENKEENYLNIHREWLVTQDPLFQTEEHEEKLDIPEQSVYHRYYDPRTSVNNVAEEIYNYKGEFVKECRMIYDGDKIARIAWHNSDAPDSSAVSVEEFVYDVKGRLISRRLAAPKEQLTIQTVYDAESRISMQLMNHKTSNAYEVILEKYEYKIGSEF